MRKAKRRCGLKGNREIFQNSQHAHGAAQPTTQIHIGGRIKKFIANNMSATYFRITYNNTGGHIENLRKEEHVSKNEGNIEQEKRSEAR